MNTSEFSAWRESLKTLRQQPLIMGIVNTTTDSFSDGGQFINSQKALSHALSLIKQGAHVIDIGGESSRPGAESISVQEELDRVLPVIEMLRNESDTVISIDTCKPEVMKEAVAAGAGLINDIRALKADDALTVAAQLNVPVCLMHMQGEPKTMQHQVHYEAPVMDELIAFFDERMNACTNAGITTNNIIIDPGFGFGKKISHNLTMIAQLKRLSIFNCPILIGVSRKSTIGELLQMTVDKRLIGSISMALLALIHGANIVRVHDVDETKQMIKIYQAVTEAAI